VSFTILCCNAFSMCHLPFYVAMHPVCVIYHFMLQCIQYYMLQNVVKYQVLPGVAVQLLVSPFSSSN
jgi:hypothetical protein